MCKQDGAGWCPEKDDCQQFPSPCPDIDKGWYMGNATHMPTGSFWPDTNQHEGYCSAHPPPPPPPPPPPLLPPPLFLFSVASFVFF
eukprot:COSAG04_NODE_1730_length_5772_cov_79.772078_1_plen_85_part_10